jgi:AcrR family transcriptional regulator
MLIETKGSERLNMAEVAVKAGISIGSLYQYFPDKTQIIRALAVQSLDQTHVALKSQFAQVDSQAHALELLDAALEAYYVQFLARPLLRDLWAGTQADAMLHDINIEDSRRNGLVVHSALKALVAPARQSDFQTTCFLLMHLSGATVALAVQSNPQEGRALVDGFKQSLKREVSYFFKADTEAE